MTSVITGCGDWLNSTPAETKVEPFSLSVWSQRKTNPKHESTQYFCRNSSIYCCIESYSECSKCCLSALTIVFATRIDDTMFEVNPDLRNFMCVKSLLLLWNTQLQLKTFAVVNWELNNVSFYQKWWILWIREVIFICRPYLLLFFF